MGPEAKMTGRGRVRSSPDVAFDLWLDHQLHVIYDQVAKEPIPQELLDLIRKDQAGKE